MKLLDTATSVWQFLKEHGGLDLKRYDEGVAQELFDALKKIAPGSPDGRLESLLKSNAISVEEFLIAFFRTVQPFSDMMSDLLRLFEKAGVTHGKENLQVRFHFDEKAEPLDFDLKHFRQWQELWQRVADSYLVNVWTYRTLWKLNDAIRQFKPDVRDAQLQTWLHQYSRSRDQPGRLPDEDLPVPKSGSAELDALFDRIWSLWLTVVRETKRHSSERDVLDRLWREDWNRSSTVAAAEPSPAGEVDKLRYPSDQHSELWPLSLLGQLDNDGWSGSLAQGVYARAEAIRSMPEPDRSEAAYALAENLASVFASLEVVERTTESLQRKLLDFLNLPVWKRRHELYSAWIMTQILGAVGDENIEIHSVNGRLLFEFKPTHLATLPSRQPPLHLMAEVRSSLANPLGIGRKNSIQPDYSLIPSPITSPECSLLEVECKQYLKAARKKFVHALSDYARGRPRARIVLVNYGPASDSILEGIETDLRDRTRILGTMRPRSESAQATFAQWVREAAPSHPTASSAVRTTSRTLPSPHVGMGLAGEIRLKWEGAPRDLDLHLAIRLDGKTTNISYSAMGEVSSEPWAQLDHDDRTGHGSETIKIGKWLNATYHCAVHNYSNEKPLVESGAKLTFTIGERILRFACPPNGAGRWWVVFSYNENELQVLDRITDSFSM